MLESHANDKSRSPSTDDGREMIVLGIEVAVGLNVMMSPLSSPMASCLPLADQDTVRIFGEYQHVYPGVYIKNPTHERQV